MARMGQKCGNPQWGRPTVNVPAGITEFERVVQELGLKDQQAQRKSQKLREWVTKHRNQRFVPEDLLLAFDLKVQLDVDGRKYRWA